MSTQILSLPEKLGQDKRSSLFVNVEIFIALTPWQNAFLLFFA
jgi:hypothetical protein